MVAVLETSSQIICSLCAPMKNEKKWANHSLMSHTNFEASLKNCQISCHMLTHNNNITEKEKQATPTQTNLWRMAITYIFVPHELQCN